MNFECIGRCVWYFPDAVFYCNVSSTWSILLSNFNYFTFNTYKNINSHILIIKYFNNFHLFYNCILIEPVWLSFIMSTKSFIFFNKKFKAVSILDIIKSLSNYFKMYSCIFFIFFPPQILALLLLSAYGDFWVRLYYLCHVKTKH